MHDNEQAIALYEKLGFRRAPVFAVKRKNVINEKLYTAVSSDDADFNPYARLIVDEARRRGISVELDRCGRRVLPAVLWREGCYVPGIAERVHECGGDVDL